MKDVWPISAKLGHLYRVKLSVVMNDVWSISAKLGHLYRVKLSVVMNDVWILSTQLVKKKNLSFYRVMLFSCNE